MLSVQSLKKEINNFCSLKGIVKNDIESIILTPNQIKHLTLEFRSNYQTLTVEANKFINEKMLFDINVNEKEADSDDYVILIIKGHGIFNLQVNKK